MTDTGENLADISMVELFRQEVSSQTALLTEGLLAMEKRQDDTKHLETLMRSAHSIKGAARIMGLDLAVKVAHALEDRFVAAQQGKTAITPDQTDLLLEGVDFLLKISKYPDNDIAAGVPGLQPEAEKLLQRLADMKNTTSAGGGPTAPRAEVPSGSSVATERDGHPAKEPSPNVSGMETGKTPPKPDQKVQSVRITAEHLNRMLGMVDESIVQMRWLDPFLGRLSELKKKQTDLDRMVDNLRLSLEEKTDSTRLRQQVNELSIESKDCLSTSMSHMGDLEDFSRRTEELNDRLYREALASRMRPFGDCAQGFPRMVRDLARSLGKDVNFEIIGQNTPVDREILDKLEAPLAHLLRNAVDHGIETPEQRAAAGKPNENRITLKACHHSGSLEITVADDGAGIDLERIRGKIVARGLNSGEVAERLTEQEVLNFLFLPGFSTASEVTEISGRGVGLDIVLNLAQELGGNVRVENRRPNGSAFHLQLPITLSLIRSLIVEIAGQPFVMPLARIAHLARIDASRTVTLEGKRYLRHNGKNIGLISAAETLELNDAPGGASGRPVVIINDQDNHYGLIVDRLIGECLVVVRHLDPRLGKVQDIGAVTLLNDGTPALILDIDDLLHSVDKLLAGGGLKTIARPEDDKCKKTPLRVLVADDSITVRELERKILHNHGYQVEVAVDGMAAWNSLHASHYDLLVSDVDMPRLNGIELIRRVRTEQKFGALPVIIISYKDREEDRLRGLEAGANYYLTKSSFQDNTFIKAVTDLIGKAK